LIFINISLILTQTYQPSHCLHPIAFDGEWLCVDVLWLLFPREVPKFFVLHYHMAYEEPAQPASIPSVFDPRGVHEDGRIG
jgi:hypothetical protein